MGKIGGFLEYGRQAPVYRAVRERIGDYRAVEVPLAAGPAQVQTARCMECGTPFCHACGCPLENVIPELNDLAWQERWPEALLLLLATNPFPEFTGRLCPAPCEAACVLARNDEAVAIRQIELAIVEENFARGLIQPAPPSRRLEEKVAIVGSGPAGLAAAAALNKAGFDVVVYERAAKIGGILRYGIPDFKLEKWVLDRRIALMEREGVRFEAGVNVGSDVAGDYLRKRFDAVCLCGGADIPRDLRAPGRDLAGIHFAMDYLAARNKNNAGEQSDSGAEMDARDKKVVIIGGGDTGADCLGTAVRQGAAGVIQLEIMPEPPRTRPAATPWPLWPAIRRDSSSHSEGGLRRWSVATTGFRGRAGRITGLDCVEVEMRGQADGRAEFLPRAGSAFELDADMVLLSLGYTAAGWNRITADLHLAGQSPAGESAPVRTDADRMTSIPGVFMAGDMRTGPSLVARAIADGLAAARGIARLCHSRKRRLGTETSPHHFAGICHG